MSAGNSVHSLEESRFIRHLMFSDNQPQWRRYASLVTGHATLRALASYELRVGLFGSLPGALGLVLRRRAYRKLFRRAGSNLVIGRNVTIRHADKICLGDNVVLDDYCVLDARGSGEEGITIGSNTIVGRSAVVQSKVGPLHIGKNVNIGGESSIVSQGGMRDRRLGADRRRVQDFRRPVQGGPADEQRHPAAAIDDRASAHWLRVFPGPRRHRHGRCQCREIQRGGSRSRGSGRCSRPWRLHGPPRHADRFDRQSSGSSLTTADPMSCEDRATPADRR